MAKSNPHRKDKGHRGRHREQPPKLVKEAQPANPSLLLDGAAELLHTGQPNLAVKLAERALSLLTQSTVPSTATLPALSLLGEIQVELGDGSAAFKSFEAAAALDPEGAVPEEHGGGPEKFMWLAQLCETGGRDSIRWFETGAAVLERELAALQNDPGKQEEAREKRETLNGTLSAMAEVWMTDLSLEPEAEQECERLLDKALDVEKPASAATLQTLASLRLSQSRLRDAQVALRESLSRWQDLPPEHPGVPDFAMRISLARLLMESELRDKALAVLERLVEDDDESVEAWYLGGWCHWLLSQPDGRAREGQKLDDVEPATQRYRSIGREWLRNCLRLYSLQGYQDARLKEHAVELVEELDKQLAGVDPVTLEEDQWVDEDGESADETMTREGDDAMDVG